MNKIEDLYKKKQRLALERDMCAEFYNLMLSKANQNVDSPDHYDYYLDLVEMMEPFAKEVKQSIREVNKQICEICEVDNIEKTPYSIECEDRYGFSKPEL